MPLARSLALVLLTACTVVPEPLDLAVDQETQHSARMLVGVSVDPDDGTVHVLDAWEGVFRLDGDALVQVAAPDVLMRDGEDLRPYTDLVAVGDDKFAVTVRNDGLLLDTAAQTTKQHFCYLPGSDLEFGEVQGPTISQLTHAVAWDPMTDRLFAQPQTFSGASLESAQVGTYDGGAGGQPEGWFDLKRADVSAGGMVWDGDRLLLAESSVLSTYTLGDDRPVPYVDLKEAVGAGRIEGMALRDDDALVIATRNHVRVLSGWRP